MKYRRFGKTGLNMSVFTFGAMRIPFDPKKVRGKARERSEENAVTTTKRAMELGINHIDTASGYGNSETLVGLSLRELGRDNFYITTKMSADFKYDETKRCIDESLSRMGLDHIDILDVHGINTDDKLIKALERNGCLHAMQEAQNEKKVSHIAFSSHAGPELMIKTMDTGLFSAVSLHYYFTYQRNEPAIARAAELDLGVLILSPSEKGGLLFKPTPQLTEACKPVTPLTLNHRWTLSNPAVTTMTLGPANPSELDAHMPSFDGPDELNAQESAALAQWLEAERSTLGNTRCTVCFKCMPCPRNVAIPEILRLRNLAKAFNMIEFGKMRYNLLGQADDWFPGEKADSCNGCGECLPRCPEKLKIPELLAETERILKDKSRKRLW